MPEEEGPSPAATRAPKSSEKSQRKYTSRVLFATGGVCLVVGYLMGASGGSDSESSAASAQQAETSDTTSEETNDSSVSTGNGRDENATGESPGTGDREDRNDAEAPPGWRVAAERFGEAFTNTSVGQEDWFAALSVWLTDAKIDQYGEVLIETVPSGALVDVTVAEPGDSLFTTARLSYDTGLVLDIGLTYDADKQSWLVNSIVPADRPATEAPTP